MKKKELLMYIITPILLLGVTITIIVAWYTNTHKIGNIDGETSDNVISYTLNDTKVNVTEYQVSNLAFFDVDNQSETKYFKDMVIVVKLEIENVTNNNLTVEINYSAIPKYQYNNSNTTGTIASNIFNTTLPSGVTSLSTSYCCGFISKNDKDNISIDTKKTIEENITEKKYKSSINDEINGNEIKIYYLYLFGVQEIDSSNNDFLKEKYNFKLTIQSTVTNTNPVETSKPSSTASTSNN